MDLSNVPEKTRAGLAVMNANKPLAGVDQPALAAECIERYLDGVEIAELAQEHNISRPRLYQVLTEHAEAKWKSAQSALALHEYELAEQNLRNATDGLQLGKAREQVKSAQWKLERVLRRIYGQDAPSISLNINLGDVRDQIKTLERDLGVIQQDAVVQHGVEIARSAPSKDGQEDDPAQDFAIIPE